MPQWTIVAHSPGLPEPADDASVETQTVPAASGQRLAASIPPDVTTLVQPRTLVDPVSSATITPDAALASDEVARTRLFLVLSAILAAACGVATPLLSGGIARRLSVTAVCFLCAALLLSFRRALTAELLANQRRWTVMCAILVASSAVAVWFFGVFSPAPMVGTFGIASTSSASVAAAGRRCTRTWAERSPTWCRRSRSRCTCFRIPGS
jgi:hypothetical protein